MHLTEERRKTTKHAHIYIYIRDIHDMYIIYRPFFYYGSFATLTFIKIIIQVPINYDIIVAFVPMVSNSAQFFLGETNCVQFNFNKIFSHKSLCTLHVFFQFKLQILSTDLYSGVYSEVIKSNRPIHIKYWLCNYVKMRDQVRKNAHKSLITIL